MRVFISIFISFYVCSAFADPLDGILVVAENNTAYERASYGGWRDADGDCQKTRDEVLIAESLTPMRLDARGCRGIAGLWYDPFTGRVFTDPRGLDIDHLVPPKEAHQSGGHAWRDETRRAYANDLANPGHLMAVHNGANRSKGARDPAEWLPPNAAFHCAYVRAWIEVKRVWNLSMDAAEVAAIRTILARC